jgi:AraC-like DNA-binding protein
MVSKAGDFAPVRFSTRELPERERLSTWRETFGRGIIRVDIDSLSDSQFRAEATLRALPGVRTVLCSGSAARFRRTRAMAAEGGGSIGLVINLGRAAVIAQRGVEVELRQGDAFPILTDEPAVLTGTRHLGVLLPHAAIASRIRNLHHAAMRVIPHHNEALNLLVNYMNRVHEDFGFGMPRLRRLVVNHIHDLAALTLDPKLTVREDGLSAIAAARLCAALACIRDCFDDPGLTVAVLARRQGISPRYLQRLLEASGTSFVARVNELRLHRALALLTDVRMIDRHISDIALQAGFSDVSNFNRLFRSRFVDTPTGIRARSVMRRKP